MNATKIQQTMDMRGNTERSLKGLIKENANRFGNRYGFSKSEIEEIYQECYKELKAGLA